MNDSMPHISDLQDLSVLKEEYKANKFENCFDVLYTKYKNVRRMRRDGSCFYRAFLFQLFEHLILQKEDRTLFNKIKQITEASKQDLMTNAGYDEIVIVDFYDAFIDAINVLPNVESEHAQSHLIGLLGNNEEANYLIMYIRWLTACYLKKNAILYEDFVGGDIAGFCIREVEQLDVDADHIQIIALTSYFEIGVEINSVDGNGTIQTIMLPEEGYDGWRPKVLYVPGHYDALYV
jgi:ubiquitin thioesterase protein OTUB1